MSRRRVGAVLVFAAAAAWGCSSRVEVDFEREEARTAVRARRPDENRGGSQWSRTRLRIVAARTLEVRPTEGRGEAEHAATAEAPLVEERARAEAARTATDAGGLGGAAEHRSVVDRGSPISIGSVHVGDVHVHRHETHIYIGPEPITDRPDQSRASMFEGSVESSDEPRCERLRRQHEARIAAWSRLFDR